MPAKIVKGILTFVAVFTAIAPILADWNATHHSNPQWPPHAKFHDAHTMVMGIFLGLAGIYFLWRRRGAPSTNLLAAGIILALYWVTQMLAFIVPNTMYTDPRFIGPEGPAAVPPQFILEVVALAVIAIGLLLLRPSTTMPDRPTRRAPR